MGFEPVAKALVLSLLLTSFFMVNAFAAEEDILDKHRHDRFGPADSPIMAPGHHQRHHKQNPPTHAHTKPSTHPPVKPPSISPFKPPSHDGHPPVKPNCHPPVEPPSYPPIVQPPTYAPGPLPMQLLSVHGNVNCGSCESRGSADPFSGSKPLPGAEVRLECNTMRFDGKTDESGIFLIAPKTVSNFEAPYCRVTLLSSHSENCSVPTDYNYDGGISGAYLMPDNKPDDSNPPPVVIYRAGPFLFEPAKSVSCP